MMSYSTEYNSSNDCYSTFKICPTMTVAVKGEPSHEEEYNCVSQSNSVDSEINIETAQPQSKVNIPPPIKSKIKRHQCGECGKLFARKFTLTVHQRVHSGIKPYSCDQCEKTFAQLSTLKTHQRVHTHIKLFNCEKCDKSFVQASSLNRHLRDHHFLYNCNKCDKLFSQLSHLKFHESNHLSNDHFKRRCNDCEDSFLSKWFPALDKRNVVNSDVLTENDLLSATDPKSTKLKKEVLQEDAYATITEPKQCYCTICGKQFAKCTSDPRNHAEAICQDCCVNLPDGPCDTKPYKCDHCEKSFAYSSSLFRHRRVHSAAKYSKCDKCGKSFAHCANVEKLYKCNQCDKSYAYKRNLRTHIRLRHSNVIQNEVKVNFGKLLSPQLDSLKSHEPIINFKKFIQYVCKKCGKSFSQHGVLKSHERVIHSGINAYKCRQCDKSFTSRSFLSIHQKNHSGVSNSYNCQLCGKSFTRRNQLLIHDRSMHIGSNGTNSKQLANDCISGL